MYPTVYNIMSYFLITKLVLLTSLFLIHHIFFYFFLLYLFVFFFFFSSRRRHTRLTCDWSSDVCSSDLASAARSARVRPSALPLFPPSDLRFRRCPPLRVCHLRRRAAAALPAQAPRTAPASAQTAAPNSGRATRLRSKQSVRSHSRSFRA